MHPPPVGPVADAQDIAGPDEALDGQGHGRRRDAHVGGQAGERRGLLVVEVIED